MSLRNVWCPLLHSSMGALPWRGRGGSSFSINYLNIASVFLFPAWYFASMSPYQRECHRASDELPGWLPLARRQIQLSLSVHPTPLTPKSGMPPAGLAGLTACPLLAAVRVLFVVLHLRRTLASRQVPLAPLLASGKVPLALLASRQVPLAATLAPKPAALFGSLAGLTPSSPNPLPHPRRVPAMDRGSDPTPPFPLAPKGDAPLAPTPLSVQPPPSGAATADCPPLSRPSSLTQNIMQLTGTHRNAPAFPLGGSSAANPLNPLPSARQGGLGLAAREGVADLRDRAFHTAHPKETTGVLPGQMAPADLAPDLFCSEGGNGDLDTIHMAALVFGRRIGWQGGGLVAAAEG